MGYLVEMSISAFFLVCASSIGFLFFWRVRSLERRISVLLHAALTNTREIRQCIGRVEDGFGDLQKAENHRRAMLASLSGQVSDLNRMLTVRQSAEPPLLPPRAANAPVYVVGSEPVRGDGGLPGYRTVRRDGTAAAVVENDAEASRQRKIRRIEELFASVSQPAPDVEPDVSPAQVATVTRFPSPPRPKPEPKVAAIGLAQIFSQRRSAVNG